MSKSLNNFVGTKQIHQFNIVKDQKDQNTIIQLLAPETNLEKAIIENSEFREGLFWGKPRYGHPEGTIILHIREVLDNIERIPNLKSITREKLRLVTFIHDTFKYKEQASRRIHGRIESNHHAVYARDFAKQYIEDDILLDLIRYHDEAYYCWKLLRYERMESYQEKMDSLMQIFKNEIQLYYLFFKCDTQTGDKNQDSLYWFENTIEGIEVLEF